MRRAEGRRRRIQIVQRIHIDPDRGTAMTRSAWPKPSWATSATSSQSASLLAHQIGPGDAQMDPPRRQFARDFPRRQQHQLHALDALDRAGIFAVRPRLRASPRRARRTSQRSCPSAAPWTAPRSSDHAAPLSRATRPGRITPPTAGIDGPCPKHRRQRVIAPARWRRAAARVGCMKAEDEAVVVFQRWCGRGWPRRQRRRRRRPARPAPPAGRQTGRPPGRWRAASA